MTGTRLPALLLALAVAAGAAGCTDEPAPAPSPSPPPAPTALPTTDPDREALAATVAELGDTLAALRSALETAAAGDDAGLTTALELLVAEPAVVLTPAADGGAPPEPPQPTEPTEEGTGDGATALAPILPGPLTSREESIPYGDLLTRTLAAARGAGGAGEPALRFLADPLAGDLGAWQRAPADQLDAIARAGTAADLDATETAVLDLAGEAPRALAWVVHGLTVPGDATDAAGRALAHLAIIDLTYDQLT